MERRTTITAYRDGPLLVRGPVVVIDEDGDEIEIRRSVVPLCRCGRSRTKPLCDGTHEAVSARMRDDVSVQATADSCSATAGT